MEHPDLGNHTCVLRAADGATYTSDEHGVRPPLRWLREDPALLRGADVADRVIGKAAALLFAFGGVRSVWAECMSDGAAAFLAFAGIAFGCGERVPAIQNRDGTGLCPMEQKVLQTNDPAEAFRIFDAMIR
ncbi:MAG: DUF1893 domain-containing protein [Oscillospiraceae bacterium]|jgi:hypothetical protein|nr:DUF1893 domain-containing protein [Oscillospiraceae bacterium]